MPPKTRRTQSPTVELVVKRGALRRFHKLKQRSADLPVTVSWDRRQADRRATSSDITTQNGRLSNERRTNERRREPPYTWEFGDFLVVERPSRRKPRQR